MKNIILQHFTGTLRPLDILSIENIKAYANTIGSDYKFIEGQVFRQHLTPPCQKAIIIDEQFDEYDNVLMLDIDMFATRDLTENVFDVQGVGLHADTQVRQKQQLINHNRLKWWSSYWSGSFYKMDRETRRAMRAQLPADDSWMDFYNKPYHYEDEGIISELYTRAGLPESNIPRKWCQCSFLPKLGPGFIHIRTKITPSGPKQEKIVNYKALVQRGII